MTKHYVDSDVSFTFRQYDSAGDLVNATSVTFESRQNDDEAITATPTNSSTGVYTVTVTPTKPGALRGKFTVNYNNIDTVQTSLVKIHKTGFEVVP